MPDELIRIPHRRTMSDADHCCALIGKDQVCGRPTVVLFSIGSGSQLGLCHIHWERECDQWEEHG